MSCFRFLGGYGPHSLVTDFLGCEAPERGLKIVANCCHYRVVIVAAAIPAATLGPALGRVASVWNAHIIFQLYRLTRIGVSQMISGPQSSLCLKVKREKHLSGTPSKFTKNDP